MLAKFDSPVVFVEHLNPEPGGDIVLITLYRIHERRCSTQKTNWLKRPCGVQGHGRIKDQVSGLGKLGRHRGNLS